LIDKVPDKEFLQAYAALAAAKLIPQSIIDADGSVEEVDLLDLPLDLQVSQVAFL
jgi:hypothetical protein